MANTTMPTGAPIKFKVGTQEEFQQAIENDIIDSRSFYLVLKNDEQFYLYVGENQISANVNLTIDTALNSASTNPVTNKAVTEGIAKAADVIDNTTNTVEDGDKTTGKFYFINDDMADKQELKFTFAPGNVLDLLPISTYSATDDKRSITGAAVAAALKNIEQNLFHVTEMPETPVAGKFYYITPEAGAADTTKKLIFYVDESNQINLFDKPPENHATAEATYGLATADLYGHAKSAVAVNDTDTNLTKPYIAANGALDKNLVGATIASFARVDHKHPYPDISGIVSASDDKALNDASVSLLGQDTISFIKATTDNPYQKDDNNKIIPLTKYLSTMIEDSVTQSRTTDQNIASKLNVTGDVSLAAGLDVNGKITTNNLIVDKYGQTDEAPLVIEGEVSISKDLTVLGKSTITGAVELKNTLSTSGSVTVGGDLTQNGSVYLGKSNNKTLLTITPSTTSLPNGSIVFDGPLNATSAVFSSTISGTAISGSSLSSTGSLNVNGAASFQAGVSVKDCFTCGPISSGQAVSTNFSSKVYFGDTYSISTDGATNLNAITATSLTATDITLKSISLSFEDDTNNITNLTKRLKTGTNKVLYTEDITDTNGLIAYYVTNAITNKINTSAILVGTDTFSTDETTWNTNVGSNVTIPSMYLLNNYLTNKYQPKGNYQPAGTYLTAASVVSSYSSTGTNPINGTGVAAALAGYVANGRISTAAITSGNTNIPTGGAVYTAIANAKAFYVGTAAPETSKLWIDTSIANGAIKYYNGSSWVLVSAVWS